MPGMDDPVDHSTPEARPSPEPITEAVPIARPLTTPEFDLAAAPSIEHDMLLPTCSRGRAIGDIALFIVIVLALQVVAGIVLFIVLGSSSAAIAEGVANARASRNREMLPSMLAVMAVSSVAAIGFILKRRRQSFRSIGLYAGRLWIDAWVGVAAAIAVPLMIFVTLVGLQVFFPQLAQQMEENTERIKAMFPNVGPAGFVAVAMMVGIYEEIVFRGFVMTRLRRATGSWTAGVLISTIIFVGLHAMDQTISAVIAITVLSLAFSLLTIWRRSIIPAIVAHTLFDLVQFLILYYTAGDTWT
ncbi:MAG: CPBP family intramembrane metalloprotease [Planctomycetes bacterium]|nr:CPBP family intramembrane metalloprotease [Planctomycetota bacterium]